MNADEIHGERLQHLHTVSRLAFEISPRLAAFYGNELFMSLGDQRVSDSISKHTCVYCGSAFVGGRTVAHISVESRASAKRASESAKGATKARKKAGPAASSARKRRPQGDGSAQAGRRVVRVRLNSTLSADKTKLTKEQHLAALEDQRNTVEYLCKLCGSQVVYPGATNTQLQLAGLDGPSQPAKKPKYELAAPKTNTSHPTSTRAKDQAAQSKKDATLAAAAAIPARSKGRTESLNSTSMQMHPQSVTTASSSSSSSPCSSLPSTNSYRGIGADTGKAKLQTQTPDIANPSSGKKNKKKKKSNLLALVAANKKKAEEKSKDQGSLSLSSFLSRL